MGEGRNGWDSVLVLLALEKRLAAVVVAREYRGRWRPWGYASALLVSRVVIAALGPNTSSYFNHTILRSSLLCVPAKDILCYKLRLIVCCFFLLKKRHTLFEHGSISKCWASETGSCIARSVFLLEFGTKRPNCINFGLSIFFRWKYNNDVLLLFGLLTTTFFFALVQFISVELLVYVAKFYIKMWILDLGHY